MRIQQQEIEFGVRMPIGLWLKDHVRPGETVYLESLGYIGYFSGAYMYDWPGLVSPEVVRLHNEKGLEQNTMPSELKPDWMVVRSGEAAWMSHQPYFQDYERVATFDVWDRLAEYKYIPGRGYLQFDAAFEVYRRKSPGETR
jgi:hypothetical protein